MMNQQQSLIATIGVAAALTPLTTSFAQQPLDTFKFKGSHNSYERGLHSGPPPATPYDGARVPIDDLVLFFNSWSIELDLCLKDDGSFVVKHDCDALVRETDPSTYMFELTRDPAIFERFTIIDLQLNFNSCCNNWGTCAEREVRINNLIHAFIDPAMIYTPNDFNNVDGSTWPSLNTLLERGKHFMVYWNRDCENGTIFKSVENTDGTAGNANHTVFSVQDTSAPDGNPVVAGDRYLMTTFPGNYWDCGLFSDCDSGWDAAVAAGSNVLKTNAFNESFTDGDGVYCSVPLYVDQAYPGTEVWGTPRAPYQLLWLAIIRITTITPQPTEEVPVVVRAGAYSIFPLGGTISTPVTITARGGEVTLVNN